MFDRTVCTFYLFMSHSTQYIVHTRGKCLTQFAIYERWNGYIPMTTITDPFVQHSVLHKLNYKLSNCSICWLNHLILLPVNLCGPSFVSLIAFDYSMHRDNKTIISDKATAYAYDRIAHARPFWWQWFRPSSQIFTIIFHHDIFRS